ncbi:hypothetical protein [Parabacteroides goldsteinii]|uniref:hypothetical protein n=1 Tax=Parabacteroides goldsteinii TaxID=328812 RepID=UPI003AB1C439
MTEVFILILGGSLAAKIVTRLENEEKESISKEEIFRYIADAAFKTIEDIQERKRTGNFTNPSQN